MSYESILAKINDLTDGGKNTALEFRILLTEMLDELSGSTSGTTSGSTGGTTFPPMKVSFGDTNDSSSPEIHSRDISITDPITTDVHTGVTKLLRITIEDWDSIKDKNPVLLLDRYRAKSIVSGKNNRKSGYRHEPQESAIENNRLSEVALTSGTTMVDFIPENYFVISDESAKAKGINQNNCIISSMKAEFEYAIFFNFALRLQLTEGVIITESEQIIQMRCIMRGNIFNQQINISYSYI